MFKIDKPLPAVTEDGAPYWAAAKAGVLEMPRCADCGHWAWPPSNVCPSCLGQRLEWVAMSGRGTIFSFIIVHRPQHPAFLDDAPYNVAIVELEEGPRLHGNVRDCANEALHVGMPVDVFFEVVNDDVTLPQFRPRGRPAASPAASR
jgi:hypothetical protein